MRRYLSWIEGLTTNQYVGGSNPSRRTTFLNEGKQLRRASAFFYLQGEKVRFEGSKTQHSPDVALLSSFVRDKACRTKGIYVLFD